MLSLVEIEDKNSCLRDEHFSLTKKVKWERKGAGGCIDRRIRELGVEWRKYGDGNRNEETY